MEVLWDSGTVAYLTILWGTCTDVDAWLYSLAHTKIDFCPLQQVITVLCALCLRKTNASDGLKLKKNSVR